MRGIHWFGQKEIEGVAASSKRRLCKLVVSSIRPGTETPMLRPKWQPKLRGKMPVMQSDHFQLSYVTAQAPQEVHWHRLQVETYSSASPMVVVAVDVDERLRDSAQIALEFIPAGRVFIPPRFCHLVHLSGVTEVLQIRTEPGSLEQDSHTCDDCPREGCRCEEMQQLLREAVAQHLGPDPADAG